MASIKELLTSVKDESPVWVGRTKLLEMLTDIGESNTSSCMYVCPGDHSDWIGSDQIWQRRWDVLAAQIGEEVLSNDTGILCIQSGDDGLVVLPPFPVAQNIKFDHLNYDELYKCLSLDYVVGVVLLRLGRFSVAIFKGTDLVVSKTDSRFVKGRHKKGGSSQRRFERTREGQSRKLFDKVCDTVGNVFEPYTRTLDYVLLGGDSITINNFLKVCPKMESLKSKILPRRLNIRDPKRDTLEHVGNLLLQSRLYFVRWDQ